jgi:hypothetical protein
MTWAGLSQVDKGLGKQALIDLDNLSSNFFYLAKFSTSAIV